MYISFLSYWFLFILIFLPLSFPVAFLYDLSSLLFLLYFIIPYSIHHSSSPLSSPLSIFFQPFSPPFSVTPFYYLLLFLSSFLFSSSPLSFPLSIFLHHSYPSIFILLFLSSLFHLLPLPSHALHLISISQFSHPGSPWFICQLLCHTSALPFSVQPTSSISCQPENYSFHIKLSHKGDEFASCLTQTNSLML